MITEKLTWHELRKLGSFDKGNRFYPSDSVAKEYISINGYRSPSRAYPFSYAKPLMTAKFIKWVNANYPDFTI